MIRSTRELFNQSFSKEKQRHIQSYFNNNYPNQLGFKLSESPIFISNNLQEKLFAVSESIIHQIVNQTILTDFSRVPANQNVPNCKGKPHFLAIDFAICKNNNQEIEPQLIELQAFPSLFFYQVSLAQQFQQQYPFLNDFNFLLNHHSTKDYTQHLQELITANQPPENTIILELFPEQQKTKIDFSITKEHLGIETVCLTKIIKKGKTLYYQKNNQEIKINRIYNRLIFDDLEQYPDLKTQFNLTDNVEVDWVTHPNWFFVISKAILPKLQHQYIPKSYFVNDFPDNEINNLSNYVLKPLFSFAGQGVNLNPKQEDINKIQNKKDYILQKKVAYAPVFKDINNDFSKAELRLLYTWMPEDDLPKAAISLVRMSKSAMINVSHNQKSEVFTGSSVAFFNKD